MTAVLEVRHATKSLRGVRALDRSRLPVVK